jgi:hypothetical protein
MTTPDARVLIDFEQDINPASGVFPSPIWTDVSSYMRAPRNGQGFSIVRGRHRETDRIEAGRFAVDLGNEGGEFIPTNIESPFYPFVLPDRRIRIVADAETGLTPFRMRSSRNRGGDVQRGRAIAEIVLADGIIDGWSFTFPGRGADALAHVAAVDLMAAMAQDEVTASTPVEQTGQRIARLLDEATYAGERDLDEGEFEVQATEYDADNLLDAVRQAETSEGGVFYVARDGRLTFRSKAARLQPPAPGARFSVTAPDHPFVDIALEFDRTLIRNIIRATSPSVTPVELQDSASIARHGERIQDLEAIVSDETELLTLAQDYLARHGRPVMAVRELDLSDITTDWPFVLSRDIWDAVTLEVELVADLVYEQPSLIEGIRIASPRRSRWLGVWRLSPQEFPELLTENQTSLEDGDADGWDDETNCTVAAVLEGTFYLGSVSKALHGSYALEVRPLADGEVSAITTPSGGIAVEEGLLYRVTSNLARGRVLFGGSPSSMGLHLEVDWRTAGGSFISTSVGASRTLSSHVQSWLGLELSAQAPATAAKADLRVVIEDHEDDGFGGTIPIYYYLDLSSFRRVA